MVKKRTLEASAVTRQSVKNRVATVRERQYDLKVAVQKLFFSDSCKLLINVILQVNANSIEKSPAK